MEPLVPTLTFEQLRRAKQNASKSLQSLNIDLSSSTTGNFVANVLGYQNWSIAKAATEKHSPDLIFSEYTGLKLKEAYLNVIENASTMLQETTGLIRSESERYTTFIDKGFDLELHFSLPIPPDKEKIPSNIIGLYVTLKIPFYSDFGLLIKYDEKTKSFTVKNESFISSYEIETKHVATNDGVFIIVRQLIKAFRKMSAEKNQLIASLISKRFYNGIKEIHFDTLNMHDAWDNSYLFFHDIERKTVYFNDVTGRNLTSVINNIEKIYSYFNPKSKPEDISLSSKFIKWFRGEQDIHESKEKDYKKTTEILILFKHLDNRSIIVMDHEFHQIRGIQPMEIQQGIHAMLSKFFPVKPTGIYIT